MTHASTNHETTIRVMFGGDVMLGRIVKDYILRYGSTYPLDPVTKLMQEPDITIVNLECAITSSSEIWPGAPKAFYFGAPPQAIDTLLDAGIDMVSLANNHTLDFSVKGLLDTLHHLNRHGIRYAGAGINSTEASSPAILDYRGMRLGMAAFCDHQADFAAQQDSPGIAYLDLEDEDAAIAVLRKALQPLQEAEVDWPILSLHWGPNMVSQPSNKFRRLAHAVVDMGWKILFGHSAHVFHGIEIYRGCPIIYAAGDLVDDYYVDPQFRNDHQLLFELELSASTLRNIYLHPVFIENCQTKIATKQQTEYSVTRMRSLCRDMGTKLHLDDKNRWNVE